MIKKKIEIEGLKAEYWATDTGLIYSTKSKKFLKPTLNHKGYNISDQQVKDLEALRELVLSNLRLKQAQAGLNDDKDNHTEVAQNVPKSEVLEPSEPINGGVVKTDSTLIAGEQNGN